jgi:hypothetical protein
VTASSITFAAATCSWIDRATGLPEVDVNSIISESLSRSFFVGNVGYRFCNFMEVQAQVDVGRQRILSRGFTPSSRMYRAPSFAFLPSHAFSSTQDIFEESDAVRFTQVVGARTVSPEVLGAGGGILAGAVVGAGVGSVVPGIGTAVGAVAGGIVVGLGGEIGLRQALGFPPIWSKIQIRIYRDGRTEAQLLQHSLFPSLTFYCQANRDFSRVNHPNGQRHYNATKSDELPAWQSRGWGPLQSTSQPGPISGNPWGLTKGVTGAADIVPTPAN